jgi:hypothetical protein
MKIVLFEPDRRVIARFQRQALGGRRLGLD